MNDWLFTKSVASKITFTKVDGTHVFIINLEDGTLEAGPGLSNEEATREFFAIMVEMFPQLVRTFKDAT